MQAAAVLSSGMGAAAAAVLTAAAAARYTSTAAALDPASAPPTERIRERIPRGLQCDVAGRQYALGRDCFDGVAHVVAPTAEVEARCRLWCGLGVLIYMAVAWPQQRERGKQWRGLKQKLVRHLIAGVCLCYDPIEHLVRSRTCLGP